MRQKVKVISEKKAVTMQIPDDILYDAVAGQVPLRPADQVRISGQVKSRIKVNSLDLLIIYNFKRLSPTNILFFKKEVKLQPHFKELTRYKKST